VACTEKRRDQLRDWVSGRLDPSTGLGILEHVERCPPCSQELDLYSDLLAAGEQAGGALYSGVRPSVVRLHLWVPVASLAAAAAVVALLWLGGATHLDNTVVVRQLASLTPLPSPAVTLRATTLEPSSGFRQAMDAYREGNFADAVTRFQRLNSSAAAEPLALLYLGISQLQLDPDSAVQPLQAAAAASAGLLQEHALWYLANAHLSRGDSANAAATLQTLHDLGGDYAPNAAVKLTALRHRTGY
jgi:hypothetical protein